MDYTEVTLPGGDPDFLSTSLKSKESFLSPILFCSLVYFAVLGIDLKVFTMNYISQPF